VITLFSYAFTYFIKYAKKNFAEISTIKI